MFIFSVPTCPGPARRTGPGAHGAGRLVPAAQPRNCTAAVLSGVVRNLYGFVRVVAASRWARARVAVAKKSEDDEDHDVDNGDRT